MPSRTRLTLRAIFSRCGGRQRVATAMGMNNPLSLGHWVRAGCPPPSAWPILVEISNLKYGQLHTLWRETLGANFTAPSAMEDESWQPEQATRAGVDPETIATPK